MGNTDIRKVIERCNRDFMAGFHQKDAAIVSSQYADDAQLMPPNCDIITGKEAIAEFWQTSVDMGVVKDARVQIIDLEVFEDTAIDIGTYTLQSAMGQMLDTGTYVLIW
jgi:ketosteroid isomerase-like protein